MRYKQPTGSVCVMLHEVVTYSLDVVHGYHGPYDEVARYSCTA